MSVNRSSEVWKEIKPFAMRDLNAMIGGGKSGNTSSEGMFILLIDVAGQAQKEYSVSAEGLSGALAAAVAGNIVFLPPCEIGGNYTVASGVALMGFGRDASVLTGQITQAAGSLLESLSVLRTENTSSDLIAVIGPGAGKAFIRECDLEAYNCGTGNAYGIYAGAGDMECDEILARGESRAGDGYGVYQS